MTAALVVVAWTLGSFAVVCAWGLRVDRRQRIAERERRIAGIMGRASRGMRA